MNLPIDKTKAAFYGKFVDAAYTMFKRDRSNLQPEPQPGDIPVPFELVAWITMSDFAFINGEIPKFYGLIARDTTEKHSFILAIRGTEGWVEWFDDCMVHLVPFGQVPDAGRVAFGFDKIYDTLQVKHRPKPGTQAEAAPPAPLTGSFAEQIEQLADRLEDPPTQQAIHADASQRPLRSFVVTGHSLGAALTTLFVMENKDKKKFDITTCCTFGSPHVGNTEFVHFFDQLSLTSSFTSWRIANNQDIVTKIPFKVPLLFDYEHVDTLYQFTSKGVVKWDPVCWHDMKTYLHWLDPTVAIDPACALAALGAESRYLTPSAFSNLTQPPKH